MMLKINRLEVDYIVQQSERPAQGVLDVLRAEQDVEFWSVRENRVAKEGPITREGQ